MKFRAAFASLSALLAFETASASAQTAVPPLPGDDPLPPISFQLDPTTTPPPGLKPPLVSKAPRISLDLASQAAAAAVAACKGMGAPVGVAVTDSTGDLIAALAAEGTAVGRIYTALRKDLAALEFGVPTSELKQRFAREPGLMTRLRPGMSVFGGAIPLKRNGQIVGAIAVSGGNRDEACAKAGVDAISESL